MAEPVEGEIIEAEDKPKKESLQGKRRNGRVERNRPDELTPTEEAWCVAYLRHNSATDAYCAVIYGEDANGKALRPADPKAMAVAHKLAGHILNKPAVHVRVLRLRNERAQKVIDELVRQSGAYSLEKALTEASAAYEIAARKEDPKAMLLAVALKAKLCGYLVDKIEKGPPGSFEDLDVRRLLEKKSALEQERAHREGLKVVGGRG